MEAYKSSKNKDILDDVFDAFTMLADGEMVTLLDVADGYLRYSSALKELIGLPKEFMENGAEEWMQYIHPEDRKRHEALIGPLVSGKSHAYDITYRVRIKNGEYSIFRAHGSVLRGRDGNPAFIGGVMQNQGLMENVDAVTMLPGRNVWLEDLERFSDEGLPTASLMVGIKSFEEFNRFYGYAYGNRILQDVAWMIQELLKGRGKVYRIEGPNFVILSDIMEREECAALYDMIRYRLQRGIEIDGIKNILSACGGLIFSDPSSIEPPAVATCLSYAFKESKEHEHGELADFNGSFDYEGARSLELINSIREAASDGCRGFFLEYEPVMSADGKRINGAEGELCWFSENFGRICGDEFLSILEKDFMFEEIWDFVLKQGLNDGMEFLKADPEFLLCLNIYRMQLENEYFIENLLTHLRESGFPPGHLSLKLNPDCRFAGLSLLKETILSLKKEGIISIIDGFGSGTDSISFLRSLPVDAVCIDKIFIDDIVGSVRDREILLHLMEIASSCVPQINLKGVDSPDLMESLKGFPLTTMQGSYFYRPMELQELKAALKKNVI